MKKGLKWTTIITFIILVGFLIKALLAKNIEFLGYWIVLILLLFTVIRISEKFKIPTLAVILIYIWAILHMAGGLLKIGQTRLYDYVLINLIGDPYFILRFDQLVHAYCYFAISIFIYFILKNYIKKSKYILIIFSILSALGIGLLNEVLEFGMVIWANAAAEVGGYYNTALDLVFNLIGSIIGSFYASKLMD